ADDPVMDVDAANVQGWHGAKYRRNGTTLAASVVSFPPKEPAMKAVVFHGIGDIRLETVREPKIKQPGDALIRITASAICGTDLHFIRGTLSGMKSGTVLGHEA